jgi:LacI family transcriptional regulator
MFVKPCTLAHLDVLFWILQMTKRPTIADVARQAEVSVGTVSNVINDTRPVAEATRERVLNAAHALGFHMNSAAQTLRRRSSRTIGLCTTHLTTTYLRELAIALDAIVARHGYELIQVQTHQDPQIELARVQSLLGRQVDGLILLPSLAPQSSLDLIAARGTPAVVIDRQPGDARFSSVIIDNFAAMTDVVSALAGKGHRRVLFIAQNLAVATTRDRLSALRAYSDRQGDLVFQSIERGNEEDFQERLSRLLLRERPPTAIITGNSSVALSTIKMLQALGKRWPAEALCPPLSTVRAPMDEMAASTWQLLIRQLENRDSLPTSAALRTKLIIRQSI